MKVAVVGEAPSRAMREGDPPMLLARHELAALCGLTLGPFLEVFELMNVFEEWPGKEGKGDRFPLPEARALVREVIWPRLGNHQRVILLGHRVASAFHLDDEYFNTQWVFRDGANHEPTHCVSVVPHPSHVNHFWNKVENRVRARAFWTKLHELGRSELEGEANARHPTSSPRVHQVDLG